MDEQHDTGEVRVLVRDEPAAGMARDGPKRPLVDVVVGRRAVAAHRGNLALPREARHFKFGGLFPHKSGADEWRVF